MEVMRFAVTRAKKELQVAESRLEVLKLYTSEQMIKELENRVETAKAELQAQGLTIDELEVSVGYDSDRETDLNQNAVELRRSKTTGLIRQTDSDTSEEALGTNSAGGAHINKETAIA